MFSRLPYALMVFGIMSMLAGALHCVGERPTTEPVEASAGAEAPPPVVLAVTTAAASAPEPAVADAVAPEQPRAQAPVHVQPWPALSALTPSVIASLHAIAARSERMQDDVFAKLGGSSVVSHAFLYCFRGDDITLGGRPELQQTIDFFAHGRAAGMSPFTRESLATHEGWSIRHGLTGRPTRVEQEVRAISPRYAFALFGGNDVQARRPRTFHRHLLRLLDTLQGRGVIPILGSTMPRGDSAEMEEWAQRYDEVSRAVAISRQLPYMDVHSAALSLPGEGLAHDGVHPNVFLESGRPRACDMTPEGAQHGQNVRNLLAIQTLDRLRRVLTEGQDAPDPDPPSVRGEGTADAPVEVERLPFAQFRAEGMPSAMQEQGSACAPERSANSSERRYRVIVDAPRRVHAWAFTRQGDTLSIQVYGPDGQAACVSSSGDGHIDFTPGTFTIGVEQPNDEEFTFSLTAD